MKFGYDAENDSLYINLSEKVSVDSQEVREGVVLDFDDKGQLVGIDIDHASRIADIKKLDLQSLPISDLIFHA